MLQIALRTPFLQPRRLKSATPQPTGAMWCDMDWASSRMVIRRQRSGLTGELTVPKTQAGTRWIDLPAGEAHRQLERPRSAGSLSIFLCVLLEEFATWPYQFRSFY